MSRFIDIVRRVVQQELAAHRGSRLGVVTAVFPHTAEDDQHNYEIDLRLKHEDLELRKVPLTVGHVGLAVPPRIDDLVLVQFVDGDLNQPLVTGRLYHADERPPLHQEDELLFEHRVPDGTLNHLRFTADGTIIIQRDVTKPEDNSEAKTSVIIDGASGDLAIRVGEKITVTVTLDSKVEIVADGLPITVDCDRLTVNGNLDLNGDLKVSDGSHSTTISGNQVTGA